MCALSSHPRKAKNVALIDFTLEEKKALFFLFRSVGKLVTESQLDFYGIGEAEKLQGFWSPVLAQFNLEEEEKQATVLRESLRAVE